MPFCYNNCIVVRKVDMQYTLITSRGKVYTFFLKSVADTYAQAYGGVVITQQVLVDQNITVAV